MKIYFDEKVSDERNLFMNKSSFSRLISTAIKLSISNTKICPSIHSKYITNMIYGPIEWYEPVSKKDTADV